MKLLQVHTLLCYPGGDDIIPVHPAALAGSMAELYIDKVNVWISIFPFHPVKSGSWIISSICGLLLCQ